jgi:predicted transcriptional regulator
MFMNLLAQESTMAEEAREAYLQRRRSEIGQRIREVRRRASMSQEEVADYLGCSRLKVNRVEKGLTEFSN